MTEDFTTIDGDPTDISDDDTLEDEELIDDGEPLFAEDTGQMSLAARKTLVALLKRRFISSEEHPAEWRTLLDNVPLLSTRLNDMFLELIIDRDYEVAFKRQATPALVGSRFPTLLHDTAYTREETILLVTLRHTFRRARSGGDDIVYVERDDLHEQVETFRPETHTNKVQGTAATNNAIKNLLSAGILIRTAEDDRFKVAPIIEVLLSVARLKELSDWLTTATGTDTPKDEA